MTTLFTIWDKKVFYPTYLEIWWWHCSFFDLENNNVQNNQTLLRFIHGTTAVHSKMKPWTATAMIALQYKHLYFSIISAEAGALLSDVQRNGMTKTFYSEVRIIPFSLSFSCFLIVFLSLFQVFVPRIMHGDSDYSRRNWAPTSKWYTERVYNPLYCL